MLNSVGAQAIRGCVLSALLLMGCFSQTSAPEVVSTKSFVAVAAASDLQFALEEVVEQFEREHSSIDVEVTYGSSGNFFAQLSNGAPFDLYFSADISYPRKLIEQGVADEHSLLMYAVGKIVIWGPAESPIDVQELGAQSLLHPEARRIAIANPQHAPYGRAAEAALKSLGLYEQTKDRLVFGENIAQTAQFVESGAADIGIIALSLAMAPALKDRGRYWLIPVDAYPEMEQGFVIMKHARNPAASQRLRDFVSSEQGLDILSRYGFTRPRK